MNESSVIGPRVHVAEKILDGYRCGFLKQFDGEAAGVGVYPDEGVGVGHAASQSEAATGENKGSIDYFSRQTFELASLQAVPSSASHCESDAGDESDKSDKRNKSGES